MRSSKPKLKLIENKPNSEIIKHIERLLSDAREGKLTGLVYAVTWRYNQSGNGYTTLADAERMIAELAKLQAKLIFQCNLMER